MGTSPLLDVADEILQIDFGLHSCTVRHGFPTPDIPLLGIGPGRQEGAQNQEVSIAAGKMKCRIPINV